VPKVLQIMIDGVSADSFRRHLGRMPNLARLAAAGVSVERLASLVPGISLPGRASILTGRNAAEVGVYGNKIWDGTGFSYATPDDVRAPTIARRALDAGLDVASIGFGMVRPEDATVFKRPWWVDDFVQRGRDEESTPSQGAWLRVANHEDPTGRLVRAAAGAGFPADFPARFPDRLVYGLTGDMHVANWAGLLGGSSEAPDLLLTELLMTDSVQHRFGFETEAALWSLGYADTLVGVILSRLGARASEYTFVVLSDHGHFTVERVIRPDVVLPDHVTDSEGGHLHVVVDDDADAAEVAARLAPYGAVPYDNGYLPAEHRTRVRAFLAPDGVGFEPGPAEAPVTAPKNVSSHGLRPGHPADDRFMLVSGPGVAPGRVTRAEAGQVAPTVARLLGLPETDYPGAALPL
jgi:predicted AlkP superfamily pyrophosphatase or phosphodiesterase